MQFDKDILGSIAVILGLLGYMYYIQGILQGKVKPHAFSWLVWGILTLIAFFAQISEGAGAGSWVTGVTALFSFAFVLVGLRNDSRSYINRSDWYYLIFSLMAIPIWYYSGSPFFSVILITIIDFVAFLPTFRKAYYYPESENSTTYLLSGTKFIFSLIALEQLNLITYLYPLSLVIANYLFVIMMIWRKYPFSKEKVTTITGD